MAISPEPATPLLPGQLTPTAQLLITRSGVATQPTRLKPCTQFGHRTPTQSPLTRALVARALMSLQLRPTASATQFLIQQPQMATSLEPATPSPRGQPTLMAPEPTTHLEQPTPLRQQALYIQSGPQTPTQSPSTRVLAAPVVM